jgi:hypothetical protein
MNILHILPACLITFAFACIVIYCFVQEFKKQKVNKDLIYLEFLIQHGLKDNITSCSIKDMILEYEGKKEYKSKKLDRCRKLFNEKYKP